MTGCCLSHDWKEATCASPQTCSKCGKTKGEPTNVHDWVDATCTNPKTCNTCGETNGDALGHQWKEATCTEPKECKRCNETEGNPLGHDWEEATCTTPKTCKKCKLTEGDALGHEAGDWETIKKATLSDAGKKVKKCVNCSEELESNYIYKNVEYKGNHFNFSGKEFAEYLQEHLNSKYRIATSRSITVGEMNGYGIYEGSELVVAFCYKENSDGLVTAMAIMGDGSETKDNVIVFGCLAAETLDTTIDSDTYLRSILVSKTYTHNGLEFLYGSIDGNGEYPVLFIGIE